MSKRAIILAGGRGTRLYPYTIVFPKPLMPIGDFPIMEVVIRQLKQYGFTRITLAVNHQAEIIRSYFNTGTKWGLQIDYSLEKTALGTMGPLHLIEDLPEHFLVMNGDVLTDLDFANFFDEHVSHNRTFTISSCQRSQTLEYGVLNMGANKRLADFREKPTITQEVSMGVYMLSQKVLELIPRNKPYGFDALMSEMLKTDIPVHVSHHEGYWLDIGCPDDYHQAVDLFTRCNGRFLRSE